MPSANRYTKLAEEARNLTNKQLSTELSALSPFQREKIQELLPEKRDKEAFIALMQVVESEAETEKQLAYLRENLQTAGKVILQALKVFL